MSKHQERVEQFMKLAGQEVKTSPAIPDKDIRLLRAKLILEEALETVYALGFRLVAKSDHYDTDSEKDFYFYENRQGPSLEEIADGCADISVVTQGTLSACGIKDDSLLEEVDNNNLAKFGPGHSWNEDGKLIKPPGHKGPDIAKVLAQQKGKNE